MRGPENLLIVIGPELVPNETVMLYAEELIK